MSQLEVEPVPDSAKSAVAGSISTDEEALYDRQIRLWGVQGQARLQNARALLVGVNAINVEALKNLVLAGIGAVTLVDSALVETEDLGVNFFARASELGFNKAEATARRAGDLNPRVAVTVDQRAVEELDSSFVALFDVVIVENCSSTELKRLGHLTHTAGKAFFASALLGWAGYVFADFGPEHVFVYEQEQTREPSQAFETLNKQPVADSTRIKITARYNGASFADVADRNSSGQGILSTLKPRELKRASPYLAAILAIWDSTVVCAADIVAKAKTLGLAIDDVDKFADLFVQQQHAKCKPVASILGGILAQEVLNLLTQQQMPMDNTLVYDALEEQARVYSL